VLLVDHAETGFDNLNLENRRRTLMTETRTNVVSGGRMQLSGTEFKVLDPRDPATGSGGAEVSDACV
jgi:hypothetical protein